MPLPVVAIVGRPNVGKSSLFNRLIKQKLAVIESTPGVTRDRNFAPCEWTGHDFYLVDTGGMVPGSSDLMEKLIMEQAAIAIDEADVILYMVDCQTGVTDIDSRIARQLHRTKKPVLLAANKADNEQLEMDASAFYGLGFDEVHSVSATNGRGIGDLLDEIVARLPETEEESHDEGIIRVAVVGKPNVGKSSFVNSLLGEERHIVSEIPGTTRDAIDSKFKLDGKEYVLVDTAGLRKKSKIKESLEYYTTLRTIRAVQRCDVALILIDAKDGVNFQDLKIIEDVAEVGRAMILVVNKWDIFEKDDRTADVYTRQIHETMPAYSYLPVIFVSALKGQRVVKTMTLVDMVYGEFIKRISTSELNSFLEEAMEKHPPPAVKGKWIKMLYITQPFTAPPGFVIFCNFPKYVEEPYKRYLLNQLRERFGFDGCPLWIKLKARGSK